MVFLVGCGAAGGESNPYPRPRAWILISDPALIQIRSWAMILATPPADRHRSSRIPFRISAMTNGNSNKTAMRMPITIAHLTAGCTSYVGMLISVIIPPSLAYVGEMSTEKVALRGNRTPIPAYGPEASPSALATVVASYPGASPGLAQRHRLYSTPSWPCQPRSSVMRLAMGWCYRPNLARSSAIQAAEPSSQ